MIRLAVRCAPEQAELVLAELTVLAPNGVEEERGEGYVEYAIYGGEGELPELGELEAAAGDSLVEVAATEVPDDWADRWRDFHRPIPIGDRLCVRPSWEPVERRAGDASRSDSSRASEARNDVLDVVVDPGRAFGTGAHPTTRLCLELLLELAAAGEAGGALTDLGCGSGVLAIAAAKLGWDPVRGYDHEPAAVEAAAANAAANGVVAERCATTPRTMKHLGTHRPPNASFERRDLRRELPDLAPTVVANMTAPVLRDVAALLTPEAAPRTLICSGLLPAELDAAAAAFGLTGLAEVDRRADGDWAALLLRCG
jgi:ribosomal protein L11 methyltransferase